MNVGPVVRDDTTAEFFDGTAQGRFLLRRCPAGHVSEPAATQCTTCQETDLHWVEAGGGATLVSWAVSWSRPAAGEDPRPTILVIAELDEGPWWWTQLAGDPDADPPALAPGRRLRLDFKRADGESEAVPVFVLA
jgi:uncharacterized OB-fold protein